jgi:hypothetical protein
VISENVLPLVIPIVQRVNLSNNARLGIDTSENLHAQDAFPGSISVRLKQMSQQAKRHLTFGGQKRHVTFQKKKKNACNANSLRKRMPLRKISHCQWHQTNSQHLRKFGMTHKETTTVEDNAFDELQNKGQR